MGVTNYEIAILNSIIEKGEHEIKTVIELGAQNNYTTQETGKPPFMSEWYSKKGISYDCIDLAGDNNARKLDLSEVFDMGKTFDLVTDFGTSEHCVQMNEYVSVPFHGGFINSIYPVGIPKDINLGYYNAWYNKHKMARVGGLVFSVNPMTNHWHGHGYTYLGEDFYKELVKISGYEILIDEVNCAMGNCYDGKNVCALLLKTSDQFPSFNQFKNLPIYRS